jgi:thiol-disulfide isomerase/thioredoxin
MKALALALGLTLFLGQTARPATLLSEVREAIAAHDLTRAEGLVAKRRAEQGTTPEVIEAISWLGRGALAERQLERAEKHAIEAYTLAVTSLGTRPVDSDAKLATAIGAGMEVQAQVSAAQGARSEAVTYLQRELGKYSHTSLVKRIHKNINLLSLQGVPAPALDLSETIGRRRPEVDATKGKVVVLFFWAHWCPDCKTQGPILAKLLAKYESDGLTIVAPTQRFGYVAGGRPASPGDELRYIVEIRDQYYGFLADKLVPVSVANHERYGVSTTPTLVILDRKGLVREYHPGQMTEAELDAQIRPLL